MAETSKQDESPLEELHAELARIDAAEVQVELDDQFEPDAGTLVRVQHGSAYWHLLPQELVQLLKDLPAGAGAEGLQRAIEQKGSSVWHGPSPPGSRDTSP